MEARNQIEGDGCSRYSDPDEGNAVDGGDADAKGDRIRSYGGSGRVPGDLAANVDTRSVLGGSCTLVLAACILQQSQWKAT